MADEAEDKVDESKVDESTVAMEAAAAEAPKKLQRTLKKLAAKGEEPVIIAPALLHRYSSEQMRSMARMGMMDKIFSYIIATKENVYFIRPGLMWDKMQSVPLEKVNDVEYVNEFHNNTLKLVIGQTSEDVIFYDDIDGMKFYRYIKYKQWKS